MKQGAYENMLPSIKLNVMVVLKQLEICNDLECGSAHLSVLPYSVTAQNIQNYVVVQITDFPNNVLINSLDCFYNVILNLI